MKLSEMRPCDSCNGPIVPLFHVVRISIAGFNVQSTNAVLGLNQMFGGHALALAEVFSPDPSPVTIGSDQFPELEVQAFVCNKCYTEDVCLAILAEKANQAVKKKEEEVT